MDGLRLALLLGERERAAASFRRLEARYFDRRVGVYRTGDRPPEFVYTPALLGRLIVGLSELASGAEPGQLAASGERGERTALTDRIRGLLTAVAVDGALQLGQGERVLDGGVPLVLVDRLRLTVGEEATQTSGAPIMTLAGDGCRRVVARVDDGRFVTETGLAATGALSRAVKVATWARSASCRASVREAARRRPLSTSTGRPISSRSS